MDRKFIILLIFVLLAFSYVCFAQINKKDYTELKIFNPYKAISLKILVKCDHNYKTNKYVFFKVVNVFRDSNIIINAPSGLKKCEIWPLDVKLFGDVK